MIAFGESYLAWLASTIIPAFAGLALITWVNRFVRASYLSAFALGIFLWFFADTLATSASLGANSGFTGGLGQVILVLLFLAGALFFVWVDRKRNIFSPEQAVGKYGLIIPVVVALALGIHGLGEGAAYSATVFTTSSSSLLDAFGGLLPAIAYVLHKGLEPMMIGACYTVYVKRRVNTLNGMLGDSLLLTIIFVLPSLVGAAMGYFIIYETTYYFALGAGSSLYAGLRLAGPLFGTPAIIKENGSMKIIVSIIFGFIALYVASLFHG
jgi:hypothetical protein